MYWQRHRVNVRLRKVDQRSVLLSRFVKLLTAWSSVGNGVEEDGIVRRDEDSDRKGGKDEARAGG